MRLPAAIPGGSGCEAFSRLTPSPLPHDTSSPLPHGTSSGPSRVRRRYAQCITTGCVAGLRSAQIRRSHHQDAAWGTDVAGCSSRDGTAAARRCCRRSTYSIGSTPLRSETFRPGSRSHGIRTDVVAMRMSRLHTRGTTLLQRSLNGWALEQLSCGKAFECLQSVARLRYIYIGSHRSGVAHPPFDNLHERLSFTFLPCRQQVSSDAGA